MNVSYKCPRHGRFTAERKLIPAPEFATCPADDCNKQSPRCVWRGQRKSISLSQSAYERLHAESVRANVPMSEIVETLLIDIVGGSKEGA